MSDEYPGLEDFSGVVRLFPLPNLVLFPFVMQGLHIFEPRYRQMTADALQEDRLLTMALLRPGWESKTKGLPQLYPVGCVGRIISHQQLDDGRYNLQLRGLSRVQIVTEIPTEKPYRTARVQILEDIPVELPATEKKLRQRLTKLVPPWCPTQEPAAGIFRKLLESNLLLGMVCDILGYALPLALETKQDLLATLNVERRVRKLIAYLETHTPPKQAEAQTTGKFPPDFSLN
jgi:Lon protease-like protein